jgi:formylglycine-generating enzyme required for sulfatase activity
VIAGWQPTPGSGKHTHLAGGGIQGVPSPETGWDASWPALPTDKQSWDSSLIGPPTAPGSWTWTSDPGPNENRPIYRQNWYESYAFCIWDGGFLPTYREWQYAFVGGAEQRWYPWVGNTLTCCHAEYTPCSADPPDVVGNSPLGNGKWGQADLVGNLREFLLDTPPVGFGDPGDCTDCATLWRSRAGCRSGRPTVETC